MFPFNSFVVGLAFYVYLVFRNPIEASLTTLPIEIQLEPCIKQCQEDLAYPCGNRLDGTRWASSHNLLACADGCEIAYYAKNEDQCNCYCDQGNAAECVYKHPDIALIFSKCNTCQNRERSDDPQECRAGCQLASTLPGFYTNQHESRVIGDTCFLKDNTVPPSITPSKTVFPSTVPSISNIPSTSDHPSLTPSINTCPPKYELGNNAFSLLQYSDHRSQCTEACNAAGYCCTLGSGGCNNVPCNTGCHIAWFSSDLSQCKEECAFANSNENECAYTWHHDWIGTAGFSPSWKWGVGVHKCSNSGRCGCADDEEKKWGSSNDCGDGACEAGCMIAHNELNSLFFHGEDVVVDPKLDKSESELLASISKLSDYVNGNSEFEREVIKNVLSIYQKNSPLLDVSGDCLLAILDLVDDYESTYGALFLNDKTTNGFSRESNGDNLEMERVILSIQQTILDVVYSGTLSDKLQQKIHRSIIADCVRILDGRYWKTSQYFPGYVEAPLDRTIVYSIPIHASMPTYWGLKVCFADESLIRATGIYLTPGSIATVTVPSGDMVQTGFQIQVGASEADNKEKGFHRRMDRVTSTYEIKNLVTYIASPLGGGIYIKVPYQMDLGVVTITISGGVVQAPIFSMTSVRNTTAQEWNGSLRSAPGVWADFETNKFLMQVPRSWVYNYDYNHIKTLLEGRDMAMDGVSELSGYNPNTRNNYVLYLQPDLHIRASSYGVGYPQINTNIQSGPDGPISRSVAGKSDHWLITNPFATHNAICLHELGHCTLLELSIYKGETEALNNLFYAYVMNVKMGESLDSSFMKSFNYPKTQFTIDRAAINWMITTNFGNEKEMDNSNTEYDEFRYQQRGYAKYADIARLFEWDVLKNFFRQEHLNKIDGISTPLWDSDDRTYRLSLKAGVNLTPLIEFWGIHPVDPKALSERMTNSSLFLSDKVKELLNRYLTIIPKDNSEFRKHYKDVHPNVNNRCRSPLYGCGWYNEWITIWRVEHYEKAVRAGQVIINKYWSVPSMIPSSNPSAVPSNKPPSCRGYNRIQCGKKKQCVWNNGKRVIKRCLVKKPKYEDDCTKFSKERKCKKFCKWDCGVCLHKCDTEDKKKCKEEVFGRASVKLCKYKRKPNPDFKTCLDKPAED